MILSIMFIIFFNLSLWQWIFRDVHSIVLYLESGLSLFWVALGVEGFVVKERDWK